ncbi:zinc finger protein 181-like isoform X3 [Spodoptera litura]|uniref:Zinc finger protein 181-like isoform X3 n=1 Tax=Spodoptera litura TaxID=69820 RepID=A0A9J7DZ42_SPOLT|nr:zinc finger protein 181-like isoform X3 [Spodoptera litura]
METAGHSNMCRCCASEGAFKDIKSTYHWMGEEEIYADMLKDCFDINLNVSEHGEDGGICEVCITQLRNAINFKKQVQHTEEQFKKHLQNKALFRPNIVKVEVGGEEDSDGDNMGSGDDAFSGAEFDVPIKTEEDDPKPKKRSKASATTTRSKKSKSDDGEPSTKHTIKKEQENQETTTNFGQQIKIEDVRPKVELAEVNVKKTRKQRIKRLLQKYLDNLKIILECSNATMILRHGDKGYFCCYCPEAFEKPGFLKEHTLAQHKNEEIFYGNIVANGPSRFLVKLDITNLKCLLCNADIDSLENLFSHLKDKHQKNFHTDIKDQIFPFKFDSDQLKCCMCTNNVVFLTFRAVHEHMHKHYRHFICNVCDAGFINNISLSRHSVTHTKGSYKCRHCTSVFNNVFKRRNHEMRTHTNSGKPYVCHFCNQTFKEYIAKELHLSKIHNVARKYDCTACDRTFPTHSLLKVHVRRFHLMEKTCKCTECDQAFFRDGDLKKHMLTHTGVKEFKCEICSKFYAKRSTLNGHMRIHNNDKRFKCNLCGQAFVQKPSLTWHMKSKHSTSSSE